MNKALISIGSNSDKENNIILCQEMLSAIFHNISFSQAVITQPYGDGYSTDFLNQMIRLQTDMEYIKVCNLLKNIEQQMGRTLDDKRNGVVIIDIDLLVWNQEILKPEDMKREYIREFLLIF